MEHNTPPTIARIETQKQPYNLTNTGQTKDIFETILYNSKKGE